MLLSNHKLGKGIVLREEGSRVTSGTYTWCHNPWVGLRRHSESLRLSVRRWNLKQEVFISHQMKDIGMQQRWPDGLKDASIRRPDINYL